MYAWLKLVGVVAKCSNYSENHSTVTRASWLISSQIIQLTLCGLIHDPDPDILDKSKKESFKEIFPRLQWSIQNDMNW